MPLPNRRSMTSLFGVLFLLPGLVYAQPLTEVVIEGIQRVDNSSVDSVVQVKAGTEPSIAQIDADLHSIFALGYFSDVTADISEADGARVLTYRLSERPLIRSFSFSGNDELSEEKLRGLVPLKLPAFYAPRTLEPSLESIRKLYKEEGLYSARVRSRVDVNDRGEASVVFEIEEGEKVLIDEILFEGNSVLSHKELKKAIQTKERWFLSWLTGRGTYQEDVLQVDLEIIADLYYNLGYAQVAVKQPRVVSIEDGKYLQLHIEIEEGDQYRIGSVDVQGDLIESRNDLLDLVTLRNGNIFSRNQLRKDIGVLNDFYADRGHAYVNVAPLTDLKRESKTVDLVFDVEKGILVHIGRVEISGNNKTRDKVIRREMQLADGDLYNATAIRNSKRKLNNLGFFEELDLDTRRTHVPEILDLEVEVKEKATGTFSFGVGYSSIDGVIGQGSVSQTNFLGRALKLDLSASLGGSSTTYQFGLTDPYFLDRNLTLGFDIYNTEREWSDFTKKTTGGDLKLGLPVTENTRAFFIYRYEDKLIFDVDPDAPQATLDQEGASTLSSLTSSLSRNTTDYRLDPSEGTASELSFEFAGLGGTEKFAKYILDHRIYFPGRWGTVFSLHGQLGFLQEIGGEELPIDERFYLGGINTLRGFKSREVGPRDASGDFTGGSKQAYMNAEWIFPIARDMGLKGLLFFDAGNAWGDDESYFESIRYSVGAGIRWFSPLGPLRLEWGYNLDPEEFEDRSQFEFTIGAPF